MRNALAILKNKSFSLFVLFDILSALGFGMSFIGINWFILEATGINSSVGYLIALYLVGGLVAFPVAGTIVDRFSRKKTLIALNLARCLLLLCIFLVFSYHSGELYLVYLLSFLNGIGWAIYFPASKALIQEIISPKEILRANAVVEICMQAGSFLSAGLTGIIYNYLKLEGIIFINASLFFVSVLFLVPILSDSEVISKNRESFIVQFRNGMSYLNKNRFYLLFGLTMFIPFVVTVASNTILPGYVQQHLKSSSIVFGLADMAYGVGAFLSGSFTICLLKIKRTSELNMVLGFYISSMFFLTALAFNEYIAGLYIGYIFFGLSNSSLRIVTNSIAMRMIPKKKFGRTTSVWLALSMLMQLALVTFIGKFIDLVNIPAGYIILAFCMFIGFTIYYFNRLKIQENLDFYYQNEKAATVS